jgi:hypothetical protein
MRDVMRTWSQMLESNACCRTAVSNSTELSALWFSAQQDLVALAVCTNLPLHRIQTTAQDSNMRQTAWSVLARQHSSSRADDPVSGCAFLWPANSVLNSILWPALPRLLLVVELLHSPQSSPSSADKQDSPHTTGLATSTIQNQRDSYGLITLWPWHNNPQQHHVKHGGCHVRHER